jgi:Mrp family chromosome partitioning ATPase
MGRMFRIITESGPDVHHPSENGDRPTALAVEEVPYIEVGGPDGPVTSIPKPAVKVLPAPAPAPAPEPSPIPAPDSRVLSVAFHRFPKTGLRLVPAGIAPDVVAYHHPEHPVSGEYRAVRDEIRRQFEEQGSRVVVFTAAAPVAGTTTVLLNFAVALAQEAGVKVLVADANFDRPAVARRLGVSEAPGLAEVLGQTIPLAWALQPTAVTGLHVLAGGVPGDGTATAMASDFPRLLAQLRQWFDWVLVDGGVWADALGGEGFAPAADAVYPVTRQADIDRPEFADLRASVSAAGGLLRGYVTTRQ